MKKDDRVLVTCECRYKNDKGIVVRKITEHVEEPHYLVRLEKDKCETFFYEHELKLLEEKV